MGRRPCCVKEGLNRGAWSAREDRILMSYIKVHGEGKWRDLPQRAGLKRCGKSCRLRWLNYLRPGIKRGNISKEEEELIIKLHKLLGNRWSLIAGRIPGRTDNEIKNYWNTNLSRRIQSDNATHDAKKSSDASKLVQPSHEVIRTKATRFTKVVNINCCPQSHMFPPEAHKVINNLDSTNTGNPCFYSSEIVNDEDQFLMDFDVEHFLLSDSPSFNLDRSNEIVNACQEENVGVGGEYYGFERLYDETIHLQQDDANGFDHDSFAKLLSEEKEWTT